MQMGSLSIDLSVVISSLASLAIPDWLCADQKCIGGQREVLRIVLLGKI
jgi:hypothetical protein